MLDSGKKLNITYYVPFLSLFGRSFLVTSNLRTISIREFIILHRMCIDPWFKLQLSHFPGLWGCITLQCSRDSVSECLPVFFFFLSLRHPYSPWRAGPWALWVRRRSHSLLPSIPSCGWSTSKQSVISASCRTSECWHPAPLLPGYPSLILRS